MVPDDEDDDDMPIGTSMRRSFSDSHLETLKEVPGSSGRRKWEQDRRYRYYIPLPASVCIYDISYDYINQGEFHERAQYSSHWCHWSGALHRPCRKTQSYRVTQVKRCREGLEGLEGMDGRQLMGTRAGHVFW